MTVTKIDLIRHGEPVGGKKYRGQRDDPLSEKGWRQMWDTVGDFSGWHQVLASPLCRCSAFAQALHEKWDIPVKHDARLKEVAFGEWEGKTAEELKRLDPHILATFKRNPLINRPRGAEPLEAFYARVSEAWDDLLQEYRGRHVLVVCHAGVVRMVLARVLGMPLENTYNIHVATASLTRIVAEGEGEQRMISLQFHDGRLAPPSEGAE